MMSRPSIVVFDAYGTLLDVQSVLKEAMRAFGESAGAIVNLWRTKQLEYSWLRTMISAYVDFDQVSRDALTFAVAAHGISIDDANRQRLLDSWFRPLPFPDVAGALSTLQRIGLPLAILSNGSPAMLQLALEHSGLRDSFDHVLSADTVRHFKPDPAVYRIIQDRLGIAAGETLFVSSNGFDVVGAKAYGFKVCRINRDKRPLDELGLRPDFEIGSMKELPEILG